MSSFRRKTKEVKSPISVNGDSDNSTLENSSSSSTVSSPIQEGSSSGVEARVSGCKAWVNTGLGIVSSGSRDLDELLGGGIPLGSTVLYQTDSYSTYAHSLLAYHCAESLSHQHQTAVLTWSKEAYQKFIESLPSNRNLDPDLPLSQEAEKKKEGSGLTIAWQYDKYLKQQKSTSNNANNGSLPFCCSYDLSKRIQSHLLSDLASLFLPDDFPNGNLEQSLNAVYDLVKLYLETIRQVHPRAPVRVFLPDFHEFFTFCESYSSTQSHLLSRFILRLKRLVWGNRVIVNLSLHPQTLAKPILQVFQDCFDTALSVESFSGRLHCVPYEFDRFHAFLVLHKIQQIGMLAPFKPSSNRYGIIRDRRKLHIEPLHLPPEESRAFGNSGKADLVGGCASGLTSQASGKVNVGEGVQQSGGRTRKEISIEEEKTHKCSDSSCGGASCATSETASVNVSSNSGSAGKESLAQKLAAARAARQSGQSSTKSGTTTLAAIRPVSITSTKPTPSTTSLDF